MRRALFATAATVVGLIALLDYKSSSPAAGTRVAVSGSGLTQSPTTTPSTTAPPTTTGPGTGGSTATTAPPATSGTAATYTGQDVQYRYGDIQVRITVKGGRITDITIPQESATDPRSESINSQAVPMLTSEALQAQNLNFDVISGATYTSDAFAQSLQTALSQAGK